MNRICKWIFLCILCFFCYPAMAVLNDTWYTVRSTEGTNFWMTFMPNAGSKLEDRSLSLQLHATTRYDEAKVTVTLASKTYTFTVQKGKMHTFTIPESYKSDAYILEEQRTDQMRGVHVTSNYPISLYASNYGPSSYDATMVLPTSTLGQEYVIQTFSKDRNATEFAIVAINNSTKIWVTPTTATTKGNSETSPITNVSLSAGEVYLVRSASPTGDLSGTTIYANKNVAVFSGNQTAIVPYSPAYTDDHVFEQAIPLRFWGQQFAVTTAALQKYNYVRVTAIYDNTEVLCNGTLATVLAKNETYQMRVDNSAWITTSRPTACYIYLSSAAVNDIVDLPDGSIVQYGDPSMALITPMEQGLNDLNFTAFKVVDPDSIKEAERSQIPMQHYVNVVTATSAVSSMLLDGVSQAALFTPLTGNSNYSFARIPISDHVSHYIKNDKAPFTAYVYGLGSAESYAYNAGFNNRYNDYYTFVGGGGSGGGGSGGGGSGGGGGATGESGERPLDRLNNIQICISEKSLKFQAIPIADYQTIGWDFGDGTPIVWTNDPIVEHKYDSVGTYKACMIINHELVTRPGVNTVDTVHIIVDVIDTYQKTIKKNVCYGAQVTFAGQTINTYDLETNKTHTYVDSAYNIAGCDSITTLYLYVGLPDTLIYEKTVCPVQLPYSDSLFIDIPELQNLTIDSTYVYTTTCKNSDCDSTIIYTLHILPRYDFTMSDTICQGDMYKLPANVGQQIYFKDSLLNHIPTDSAGNFNFILTNGCDSIWDFSLYVAPTYTYYDTLLRVCDNDTISWQNRLYKGHKFAEAINEVLYEEVITLVDSVIYDTVLYHTSNIGCDSIHIMRLYVQSTDTIYQFQTLCASDPLTFNGTTYNFNHITQDTLVILDMSTTSSFGCDSIVQLQATIHSNFLSTEYDTVFQYQPYTWKKHEENAVYVNGTKTTTISTQTDGNFTIIDSLNTQYGCDSIHILHLFVAPSFQQDMTLHICANDTISWQNRLYVGTNFTQTIPSSPFDTIIYLATPTYHDSIMYQTMYGSDSLNTLSLFVHNTSFVIDSIVVCDNMPFTFADSVYDFSTWHKDTTILLTGIFSTQWGCDSVVDMYVTIHQTYLFAEDTSICSNEHLTWRGYDNVNYWPSGTYYDTLQTIYGCDSVFQLNLTTMPGFYNVVEMELCSNDTIVFHGEKIYYNHKLDKENQQHFYECRFDRQNGCDSIFRFIPHWLPSYHFYDTTHICLFDTVTWRGREFTQSGVYTDSLISSLGCDSIYELLILTDSNYLFIEYDTICLGQSHFWRDSLYTYDGYSVGEYNQYDRMRTTSGCSDSIYQLNLYIAPTYHFTHSDTIGINHSYLWTGHENHILYHNNNQITTIPTNQLGWIYLNDSLHTDLGCDSVWTLNLFVAPTYTNITYDTICFAETPYIWRGREIFDSNLYTDSLLSIYGTDSLFQLDIIVRAFVYTKQMIEMCEGDSFLLSNKVVYETGVYIDTLQNLENCDSIVEYTIKVHEQYHLLEREAICEKDIFEWRGHSFADFPSGRYEVSDSLISVSGCDSIYTLQLLISPVYHYFDSVQICVGDTFHFRNQILTQAGLYHDTIPTTVGCDSIYSVHLSYLCESHDTICGGEALDFNGKLLTESGVYYDSLLTKNGYDSIFVEHLFVNYPYTTTLYDTICESERYNFNGMLLNETAIYYDTLRTTGGCDSIQILNLHVLKNTQSVIYDTLCIGDSYIYSNHIITQGGIYQDTTINEDGCYHIESLYLTEIQPTQINVQYTEFCADDQYLNFAYTYEGRQPLEYSVIFSEEANEQGFVNIDHKPIEQDQLISIPYAHKQDKATYPRPGEYMAKVIIHNGICSDSLIMQSVFFKVRYPSWIIEQHWNDVISILVDSLNGGYTFSEYQWYYNGQPLFGENKPYLYIYPSLDMQGEYAVELTRTGDGQKIITCPIQPHLVEDHSVAYEATIAITPTYITKTNPTCTLYSDQDATWYIYTSTGVSLLQGKVEEQIPVQITLPSIDASYFAIVKTNKGYMKFIKLLVH